MAGSPRRGPPEPPHHRAGAGANPARPVHHRGPALRAAAQGRRLHVHRGLDEPLQARDRGAKVPAGEVYGYAEGGNGELGFYIVSDGSGKPYKCRVRSPCFTAMQLLDPILLPGAMISDIVPI